MLDAVDRPSLPMADPARLRLALGRTLASAMGGSSGVLMSILLTGAGTRLEEGASLPEALRSGAEAVQQYGGAREGERTLLDALLPGLSVLSAGGSTAEAAAAARAGAAGTQHVERTAVGRSSYPSADALSGVLAGPSEYLHAAHMSTTTLVRCVVVSAPWEAGHGGPLS